MLPQQFHATRHVGIAGARVCGTPEAHRGRCRAEYVRMLWCVVALEAGLVVHVHLLHRTRTMARVLVVMYIVPAGCTPGVPRKNDQEVSTVADI